MLARRVRHGLSATLGAAVLMLGLTSMPLAQSASLSKKATDAQAMVSAARAKGHVRVIALFESPIPPQQITGDAHVIAALMARVAAVQDAIIAAHFGDASHPKPGQGFDRNLTRFATSPGFALNVSLAELEALADDARILRVSLDQAVPHAGAQGQPAAPPGMAGTGTKPGR
jgi:hypothetical protein